MRMVSKYLRLTLTWDVFKSTCHAPLKSSTGLTLTWDVFKFPANSFSS